MRLIISLPWKGPLNLAASTCTRTLNPGGGITEVIELDGDGDDLSEEELERFCREFPGREREGAMMRWSDASYIIRRQANSLSPDTSLARDRGFRG